MKAAEQLVLVGVSHRTASVEQREKLTIDPSQLDAIYDGFLTLEGVVECFILSTCNRLEVYATVEHPDSAAAISTTLCSRAGMDPADFAQMRMTSTGLETVLHLYEVAAGIDSQIVGEAEILGQVKAAYARAGKKGAVGPVFNRILQKSFQAAKWIRTHTTIGQGQISTATVAVDLATQIFGRLDRTRVLVIGAGEISEKTARALQSRGAGSITVTSRRSETAAELARKVGGEAAALEDLGAHLAESDIVVSSTSSPSAVVTGNQAERAMRHRAHRPLFLIDLAVPRDIDPACAACDNIYLYNLDDLARRAEENLSQRRAEVRRCRSVLAERAGRLWDTIKPDPQTESGSAPGVSLSSGR